MDMECKYPIGNRITKPVPTVIILAYGIVNEKELIYHEHLGLLDEEKYRRDNLRKLNDYRKNGIYPGKNLIVTYETEGIYLNIN